MLFQFKSIDLPFIKSIKLDSNKHNAGYLNHLRLVTQSKHTYPDLFNDFRISLVRLARKQENTNLAMRLITEQVDNLYSRFLSSDQTPSENPFESLKYLSSKLLSTLNSSDQLLVLESELETAKLMYVINSNKLDSIEVYNLYICF